MEVAEVILVSRPARGAVAKGNINIHSRKERRYSNLRIVSHEQLSFIAGSSWVRSSTLCCCLSHCPKAPVGRLGVLGMLRVDNVEPTPLLPRFYLLSAAGKSPMPFTTAILSVFTI
jgi:hypothetical protein